MARDGFEKLGLPWETALVSLDLVALRHSCREWAKLRLLAADIFQRFKALGASTEAVAALAIWKKSIEADEWLEKEFDTARHYVMSGMLRHCCKSKRTSR